MPFLPGFRYVNCIGLRGGLGGFLLRGFGFVSIVPEVGLIIGKVRGTNLIGERQFQTTALSPLRALTFLLRGGFLCRRGYGPGDRPLYAGFKPAPKLFHAEQILVNGTDVARFVGSGLFCWGCICRELWCFVPCCSEWGFWFCSTVGSQVFSRFLVGLAGLKTQMSKARPEAPGPCNFSHRHRKYLLLFCHFACNLITVSR